MKYCMNDGESELLTKKIIGYSHWFCILKAKLTFSPQTLNFFLQKKRRNRVLLHWWHIIFFVGQPISLSHPGSPLTKTKCDFPIGFCFGLENKICYQQNLILTHLVQTCHTWTNWTIKPKHNHVMYKLNIGYKQTTPGSHDFNAIMLVNRWVGVMTFMFPTTI